MKARAPEYLSKDFTLTDPFNSSPKHNSVLFTIEEISNLGSGGGGIRFLTKLILFLLII